MDGEKKEGGEAAHKSGPIKGEVHLEVRAGDKSVSSTELSQFDLFRRMKKSVSVGKVTGSVVLRSYRKGEIICQQGQTGGTAFYIPTALDLARLVALKDKKEAPDEGAIDPNRDRHILTAVIISSTTRVRPKGFFEQMFSPGSKKATSRTTSIRSDGPTDIDFDTREAPLMEGDLFGEMSCISFSPRSATVIARVDCQLLEFNRHVFDQLREDPNHQAAVDAEYRRRTLETHLRQFQFFRDLSEAQIQTLKKSVELEVVPPGKIICEEGEQGTPEKPLDVFIVRNGVVQVTMNHRLSIHMDDILNWPALCSAIENSQPDHKAAPSTTPSASTPRVVQQASAGDAPTKPLSPLERMRAQKAEAAKAQESTGSKEPPAAQTEMPSVPKKSTPLEQMRAKQAAAKEVSQSAPPPSATESNLVAEQASGTGEPPKKLSPLEQIRAKQAAAKANDTNAAASKPVESDQTSEKPSDEPSPPKKLSPIELIRAKNAAAKAHDTDVPASKPVASDETMEKPSDEPGPPKKLSPIELIRAKNAAAKAHDTDVPASKPVASEETSEKPSDEPGPPKKLSPIELMRAKNAAKRKSSEGTPKSLPAAAGQNPLAQVLRAMNSSGSLEGDSQKAGDGAKGAPNSKLTLLKKPMPDQFGSPSFLVKSWLNDHVREAVQRIAKEELQGDAVQSAQRVVLSALNELLGNSTFLNHERLKVEIYSKPEILRKAATFPKGLKGIEKNWSELELRTTGRAALSEIFPDLVTRPIVASGPPRVLAYLSRGDCFGEIAVIKNEPRSATCIAYSHPSSEDVRDFGNVELVRIRGSAFLQLMADSPKLKEQVEALAEQRIRKSQTSTSRQTESDIIASEEFQQMGLFQGSRLLVIDLDSCTRCGDCVEACINTHDDGYSRLFLDGPRYDRFLVPSACRNCLNPVCMIGCPVGSIGRGENGQIEIYDWCIGCSTCADQCPYDSIQMHDMGLIPEESPAWVCAERKSLRKDWFKPRRLSGDWTRETSPVLWQGDFLRRWTRTRDESGDAQPLQLCFRHEFQLPKKSHCRYYRLSINDDRRKSAFQKVRIKKSKVVAVWLNGKPLEWSGTSLDLAASQFQRSQNLLAIEVAVEMPAVYGQFVLSACLDAVPEPGKQTQEVLGSNIQFEMDLVTSRAAVCDLCSHIPGKQPACVTSCPHDAAIRINPLVNFPT